MATARNVIKSVLRLISAIESNETPTAAESNDALTALNDMLHSWALHGVVLDHTDLTLDDEVLLPDSHMMGVKYSLAVQISPEYGMPVKADLVGIANREWTKIQAHHSNVDDVSLDQALAWNASKRNWWHN
jgi:hypothetical protein